MTKQRADLGFTSELEDFDPQAWNPPKSRTANDRLQSEQFKDIAKASGFQSREPGERSGASRLRRRRTGRNAQFNIKARPETIEAFCRIADANGWGLGETLEYAVTLLEDRYAGQESS